MSWIMIVAISYLLHKITFSLLKEDQKIQAQYYLSVLLEVILI